MYSGFKVSQKVRHKTTSYLKGQDQSLTDLKKVADNSIESAKLRFSLKQYVDLINHLWKTYLDTEHKSEVSDNKFFAFLRQNKIVNERKQMDELFK